MNEKHQIYYWAHMLDEAFNKEQFLYEDVEGKNINRAEKWIKQNHSEYLNRELTLPNGDKKVMTARDWVTQVRNDVPSSRLPKTESGKDSCKFLLGVTRLYFDFAKDTRQDEIQGKISQLEKIMKILTTSHANEYDNNLNGLSFKDLDDKFKGVIQKNLDNEINSLKSKTFKRDTSYQIVPIPNFATAKKYGKWTSWCVTHQRSMYDSYTKGGLGLFYFCLKDGFQSVKKAIGEGCPLDEYGKSMIAISVNDDGSLNTATCRWNHDNGGNDNIFKDAREVSEFFGVNFFETFKPRTADELLAKYKSEAIPSKIADKLGGVETKDGLHMMKNGRVQTWKKVYDGPEGKCYAYDHFFWFDDDGNEIDAPMKVNGTFSFPECTSLISLSGAPQEVGGDFSCSYCKSLTSLEGAPQKVSGNFDCTYCTALTSLKGAPQKVGGSFWCQRCTSLTSLEGAPQEVGGTFSFPECTSLISLEGAPQKVGGGFNCSYCKSLTSLEGAPQKVGRDFYCSNCTALTSLEGTPQKVGRDFICSYCNSLTSLKGAPQKVGRDFYCVECKSLTSLEGAPQKVGGGFQCNRCTSLTSLEGSPREVGGDFNCSYCTSLTSLEGAPQKVGGELYCLDTKISSSQKQSYLAWLQKKPTENYHEL